MDKVVADVRRNGGGLANQVAYVSPNGTLHHCENGWQKAPFFSDKVRPETRFRYASTTKLFTADAILGLVDEGRLSFESRLLEFLPPVRELKDERIADITIQDLLNHTSGFNRTIGMPDMLQLNKTPWCPGSLKRISERTLEHEPGTQPAYSNLGYCLLGVVIEQTTGVGYREYIKERYAIGEHGIRFIDGPYLDDEVRYDFRHSNFLSDDYYRYWDFAALSSSAGLSGNAVALARQVRGMLVSRPLNVTSYDYQSDKCSPTNIRGCYGYAAYQYQPEDGPFPVYIQGGHLPGASSMVMMDDRGGVLVWLGAGQPPNGFESKKMLYQRFYNRLADFYSDKE
ncbi:D-alanyl-D-alanine carboxypeptidase [Tamilnaduibacter salinus]|uniref:D-alanyl-D-alanine carboxypeptidase n=2 Tax=Tamilnaduibacter salinus TaxID=1484056 RepID=A0A2U1CUR9_9GAMM|nr:D-alanyl-D-alanine carboxypeptidase [Tamilnaduibacter salinus]